MEINKLLERRNARGLSPVISLELLSAILNIFTGDDLVKALVNHNFATEKQAVAFVERTK
jgi:hypothetical protein